MSSQRRFSRSSDDNELSLEQRLVMQLSAAMHQDDADDPHRSSSQHGFQGHTDEQNALSSGTGRENAHAHSTATDSVDISSLLGAFGSVLGGSTSTSEPSSSQGAPNRSFGSAEPHADHLPVLGPTHQHHDQTNMSSPNMSSLMQANLGGLSTDALIASLLGGHSAGTGHASASQPSAGFASSSQPNTGTPSVGSAGANQFGFNQNTLAQLGDLGQPTSSLGALESSSVGTGLHLPGHDTSAGGHGNLSLGDVSHLLDSIAHASNDWRSKHAGPEAQNQARPETLVPSRHEFPSTNSQGLSDSATSLSAHPGASAGVTQGAATGASTGASTGATGATAAPMAHDASAIGSTSIDPEVSSIQSVLQLLLTGGAKETTNVGTDLATSSGHALQPASSVPGHHAPADSAANLSTSASSSANTGQSEVSTQGAARASETAGSGTDYESLFGTALGAEDQGLIESLKNAINMAFTGSDSSRADSAGPSSQTAALPSSYSGHRASDDFSASMGSEPSGPSSSLTSSRQRRSKPITAMEPVTSTMEGSRQSDFNASDPDTLRAIQQALLSALGPSAASTSLAESLTSTQPQGQAERRTLLPKPGDSRLAPVLPRPQGQDLSIVGRPATQLPGSSQSLLSSAAGPSSPLKKVTEPRVTKGALKRPVARVVRPAEVDKQKQREENAARKRKWREVNQMQNRDHDLRQRIIKKAHEVYGDKDTEEKSAWVEQEFNRRRNRRIIRAGIHSIVESAKARAAKAQETGDDSLLPFGRSHLSTVAGTLSQQSRQAASSHLSNLFRNSNAALEPQLSSDKVPVPLTPYMLVATPKRPAYKLESTSRMQSTPAATSSKPEQAKPMEEHNRQRETVGAASDKSDEPKAVSDGRAVESIAPQASVEKSQTETETKVSESTPSAIPNKDAAKTALTAEKPDTMAETSKSTDNDDKNSAGSSVGSSTGSSNGSDVGSTTNKVSEEPQASPPSVETAAVPNRPKHRYALVGDIKLGVPPNLSALYQRVKGCSPQHFFMQKLASKPAEESPKQQDSMDAVVENNN